MTKFTPGPWNVEKTNRHAVVDNAQDGVWKFVAETTSRENANLISAAPELFEALERCLNDDAGGLNPKTVHMAMEAIRKARGES